MRIVTWNVNSVRARMVRLLAFLDKAQPDVACLQETKVVDEDFPAAALQERGWRVAFHGQKTYNGVAILARGEITDVERGFADGDEDAESRMIAATVGGVRFVCVYVPNGQAVGSPKFTYKLRWLHRLRLFLDRRHKKDEPLVLCGDFNVAPEDRDVWDPELWRGRVHFSDEEKAALRDVAGFGLHDALRLVNQDGGIYTWWDYRMGAFHRGWGLRIDHFLVTEPVARRVSSVRVDRDERKGKEASDHAPLIAEVDASGLA
jgi:exodeoxyribonuclease-3